MLGLAVLAIASREPQPHGVNFYTVFAEERRAVHSPAVRLGYLNRPPAQGELAAFGVVGGHKHFVLLDSRILMITIVS
jgi:hypothetical protein